MANNSPTAQAERKGLPTWVKLMIGLSLAGFALLVLGGLALISFMSNNSDPVFLENPQPSTTAEIESLARIDIPASASNIHAQAGGFQDRYIHVRFDLPPADLNSFLGATRYTPAVSQSTDIPFQQSLEPNQNWWQPAMAKSFLAGAGFVDGISQSVLIDTTNPELYIVYVQTFET